VSREKGGKAKRSKSRKVQESEGRRMAFAETVGTGRAVERPDHRYYWQIGVWDGLAAIPPATDEVPKYGDVLAADVVVGVLARRVKHRDLDRKSVPGLVMVNARHEAFVEFVEPV
jgi:hypothetical protein